MPPIRPKGKAEINHIAFFVIGILGVVAVISTGWSGFLIYEAVSSENEIDSAAVALIGQMVSIATLTIGGLIAMLTSTGPKPPPPPPPPLVTDETGQQSIAVTAVNPPEDPVNTTDGPAAAAPADPPTDVVVEELEPIVDAGDPEEPEAPPRRRR